MTKQIPQFRAYCDICNGGGPWYDITPDKARAWRELHFDSEHPENPMVKQNCRIQRRKVEVEQVYENPEKQARMLSKMIAEENNE